MNNHPINFQHEMLNDYFNIQPSTVKGRANLGTAYHKRYLYQKLYSVYEFELPSYWALNWFRWWLFHFGSIGVVYSRQYGWVAQPYSIVRLDYQYNPREILVYNSFIKNEIKGLIGYNAGIIHLLDDYFSLDDIVTHYAEMLAQVERSVNVNLMNSNVTLLAKAKNKGQGEDIKHAYQKATAGEPLVVINKDLIGEEDLVNFLPSVSQNFITLDLMEARRAIVNAFLTDVGIRNVSVQKKERLVTSETTENNDETSALATVIYENIKHDFDYINKLSGLSLRVKLRYNYSSELPGGDANDGS